MDARMTSMPHKEGKLKMRSSFREHFGGDLMHTGRHGQVIADASRPQPGDEDNELPEPDRRRFNSEPRAGGVCRCRSCRAMQMMYKHELRGEQN